MNELIIEKIIIEKKKSQIHDNASPLKQGYAIVMLHASHISDIIFKMRPVLMVA
jgi:hypothetical protein